MQEQERLGDKNQSHVVQIMTTEHYNLQSARSLATSEAAGRSSLFLSTVSIGLVALALVGQASALGRAFFVFALVLFPSLFFLGLVTFQRTFQIDLEDFVSTPGMIGMIDSILGGTFAGLLVYQLFSLSLLLCCTMGLVVFLGILVALYRSSLKRWKRFQRSVKPLFPTPVQVE